ncbi:Histone H4 [Nymphaea thermarum]|nr:Histone H4 [Nymphaea thermarum]
MSGRGKGGKGLGKGGAKRHRKVLRDNIQGITKPAIRRLARRGGVKRISGLIYEETRGVLKIFLENVIRDAVTYTEHARRKTVTAMDVVYALKRQGRTLYGFEVPSPIWKAKHREETKDEGEGGDADGDDDNGGHVLFPMRKLCPNFDREDALETVLEVPVPEEVLTQCGSPRARSWQNVRTWLKCSHASPDRMMLTGGGGGSRGASSSEIQLLLNVVGAPLIPLAVQNEQPANGSIKDHPITEKQSMVVCFNQTAKHGMALCFNLALQRFCSVVSINIEIADCVAQESSTAKYIVQQYLAATGGLQAMSSLSSMYAIGKVRMRASEFHQGDAGKPRNNSELGAFVLWTKNPDLWYLELVLFGYKMSAGSDGKLAWRQTPWLQSHAMRGPPRPLRRLLQGLDPRTTANLFSNANCIGEKVINNEDCFILKLETGAQTLKARSSSSLDIIYHTIWGYFSQRTGLLLQFEDTHLLRMKGKGDESIFWETSMESTIEDYRFVEGINIAHSGRTLVSLFRYGEPSTSHRTKMEETWTIEEVDFNIWGLSMDCFLPPADLKREEGD